MRAKGAVRSGSILDHDRNAKRVAELLAEEPRHKIKRRTWWKRHHHGDGFCRPGLRGRGHSKTETGEAKRKENSQPMHSHIYAHPRGAATARGEDDGPELTVSRSWASPRC